MQLHSLAASCTALVYNSRRSHSKRHRQLHLVVQPSGWDQCVTLLAPLLFGFRVPVVHFVAVTLPLHAPPGCVL